MILFWSCTKFECCLCDCSYWCSIITKCSGYLSVSVLVPQCQTTVAFKYSIKHVKYSWLLIACLAQLI